MPLFRNVEGLSQRFNECVGCFPVVERGDSELRIIAP
jgi:hypothetical protein